MNTDIRVSTSFRAHRKRLKLSRTLGIADAAGLLIDLWITAAQDRPEGILYDWDAEDIALAAGWKDDPAEFVKALIDHKWLDSGDGETFILHDWCEHQGWACGAKARTAAARKAANARWEKKHNGKDAKGNAGECGPQSRSNAPSPSPSPSPKKEYSASDDAANNKNGGGSYRTKKKRKLSGESLRAFERFWDAFAYKEGKAEAADAWIDIQDLTPDLVSQIIEAAKREAKRRPGIRDRGGIPKMGQGWLSGRRWEDEHAPKAETSEPDQPPLEKVLS